MAGRGRRQARLGEGPFGKHEARCGKCAAGENVPAGWKSLVIVHHGILSNFGRWAMSFHPTSAKVQRQSRNSNHIEKPYYFGFVLPNSRSRAKSRATPVTFATVRSDANACGE
jgi:hypothetical protein